MLHQAILALHPSHKPLESIPPDPHDTHHKPTPRNRSPDRLRYSKPLHPLPYHLPIHAASFPLVRTPQLLLVKSQREINAPAQRHRQGRPEQIGMATAARREGVCEDQGGGRECAKRAEVGFRERLKTEEGGVRCCG